jgi:hypothetical protein
MLGVYMCNYIRKGSGYLARGVRLDSFSKNLFYTSNSFKYDVWNEQCNTTRDNNSMKKNRNRSIKYI